MDHNDIEEFHNDDLHDLPPGLLCSKANSLSDSLIGLLGTALEENRLALTYKLGLSSDVPLPEALTQWCHLSGSTVFVLRGVLIDLGRRDLAQRLLLVEEIDLNTDQVRRQFYTVSTHCDVTLASALGPCLQGNLNNYRIIGPDESLTWSTPANTLKGKQLTLRRYLTSKTEKAMYGCNTDDIDMTELKGQVDKADLNRPLQGMSELRGPYTMSVNNGEDLDNTSLKTPLKRAQTMPTFFNIHPEDANDQLHAIEDLKPGPVYRAPSSESVTSNMAAMNTLLSPSTGASFSNVGQGHASWGGTSPSMTSVDYEFTLDDSTYVKIPVQNRPLPQRGNDCASIVSSDTNTDCVPIFKGEPKKESNVDVNMSVANRNTAVTNSKAVMGISNVSVVNSNSNMSVASSNMAVLNSSVSHGPDGVPNMSIFQESFSGNNFHAPSQTELNQLSGPTEPKYQRNDLNCTARSNATFSIPPVSNVSRVNDQSKNLNTQAAAPPKFENVKLGFKELNESMDSLTEESVYYRDSRAHTNDLDMSSSLDLAVGYNTDSHRDHVSNVYTPLSALISPLSVDHSHQEMHSNSMDVLDESSTSTQSASEHEEENKYAGLPLHKATDANVNNPVFHSKEKNGLSLAVQEQELKLRKFNSSNSNQPLQEHIETYSLSPYSCDLKFDSSSTTRSPFVHTPPPPIYSSSGTVPPSYLDVTSMHGHDMPPWEISSHPSHQALFYNAHGAVLPSHASIHGRGIGPEHFHSQGPPMFIPTSSIPVHSNAFTSMGQVRHVGIQTPPVRRHRNPPSRAVSCVSEPAMRRTSRAMSTDDQDDDVGQTGPYLTPINDCGFQNLAHHANPFHPQTAQQPKTNVIPGTVDADEYHYIDTRQMRHDRFRPTGSLRVPNRAPPPPPRMQMHLDDQLSRIQGWCPNVTDSSIEATMKDFKSQNGYFIVWKSQFKNRYIITVSHKNELLHFLIEQERPDRDRARMVYYLYKGGFSSESLLELVNHYISCGVKRRLNDSPIGTKAYVCEHIPLRRPLKVKELKKQTSVGSG